MVIDEKVVKIQIVSDTHIYDLYLVGHSGTRAISKYYKCLL